MSQDEIERRFLSNCESQADKLTELRLGGSVFKFIFILALVVPQSFAWADDDFIADDSVANGSSSCPGVIWNDGTCNPVSVRSLSPDKIAEVDAAALAVSNAAPNEIAQTSDSRQKFAENSCYYQVFCEYGTSTTLKLDERLGDKMVEAPGMFYINKAPVTRVIKMTQ